MSESHQVPPLWTRRTGGIVSVHGEVDLATCALFRSVVDAVVEDARVGRESALLDLSGLEFIDVSGARVLVEAVTERLDGLDLVVRHPPAMLVRIIEIAWGKVSGLRWE